MVSRYMLDQVGDQVDGAQRTTFHLPSHLSVVTDEFYIVMMPGCLCPACFVQYKVYHLLSL